jgi:hypothetical protein
LSRRSKAKPKARNRAGSFQLCGNSVGAKTPRWIEFLSMALVIRFPNNADVIAGVKVVKRRCLREWNADKKYRINSAA